MNRKMKWIALLLAVLCCLPMLVACSKETKSDYEKVKEKGNLVIGITYYAPMDYFEDDELVGFDYEYACAVAKKLGVEVLPTVINWKAKETLLKSGNIDCIWNGLTVTEERKADMAFSTPYLKNKQCIVINKADAEKYTDTASLAAATLTAESGSAGETAIQADASLKQGKYAGSETQQAALTAVLTGNADAAVVDVTLAKAVCGNGDFEALTYLSVELTDELYAVGFRIGSDLVEKVNAATEELVADGTLAALAEKYNMTDLYNAVFAK